MGYRTRDFTGEATAGFQSLSNAAGIILDKRKSDLMAKEGAQRIKESEQQQLMNQRKIDQGKAVETLNAETETRGALTPKAMEGTKTADGNSVDMMAVKSAKQADSDAKLYNLVNQGKEGFMPMSGGAFRKMAEARSLEANKADQESIRTEERATETHKSKMANDKAAREAGKYQPIVLDGGGIGRFNSKSGTVEDTGAKAPPKPAPRATDPDAGLPLDVKKQIEVLSSKNAGKIAIANQLKSDVAQIRKALGYDENGKPIPGAKRDEDLAYTYSQSALKTMNSKEGADAVGVDEAKRSAGLLEFNKGDVVAGLGMKPGKFIGRDLDGFLSQIASIAEGVEGSVTANKAEVDKLYGRKSGAAPGGSSKFKILSVED